MASFNASDIIGKTLYAKKTLVVKNLPSDNAPSLYSVSSGQMVGIVDSYIEPKAGRNSNLYWKLTGPTPKYIEHKEGNFSDKAITTQGGVSLEQQKINEEKANETFGQKIERYGIWIGVSLMAFILFRDQLKK